MLLWPFQTTFIVQYFVVIKDHLGYMYLGPEHLVVYVEGVLHYEQNGYELSHNL